SLTYLPSSPTLFNSGTQHTQLSSCYLLDSPQDDLEAIYERYKDVARLSKYAGGIGLAYHRIRSRGSLIQGTNGESNGIVPWLKTLDSSVAAVNQGGRRKGAACVYLETWHADIEEFLELRENTGDEARRTHNLNLANWVPDLFMQRVADGGTWSLFDPAKTPHFTDLFGDDFKVAYEAAEEAALYERQLPARELYARMMRTLAQTGNGWMTFKDTSNTRCNQTGTGTTGGVPNTVHLSNLCTEILEVTSESETAVCNLGSINLGKLVRTAEDGSTSFDFKGLSEVVRTAVKYLDRVIDINFYPTEESGSSNSRWRPVGLGTMGLQDVLFKMRVDFDSAEALEMTSLIAEHVYLNAMRTSCKLAEVSGAHPAFGETRAAQGNLQFDLWDVKPTLTKEWAELKRDIEKHGLRNSLVIAIAPTATIASIAGCYECIEPQVSNLFKRETLSGDFMQINNYLVDDLKSLGLWTDNMRSKIKREEGSVQTVDELPENLRKLYRTAWELPQKALIDMAAARGPFIDQSQSLNLFMASPTIGKLSSMYAYAWKKGLKTTYYLRSRPATRIRQTSADPAAAANQDEAAVACSLENPESCESCN
ncbi:MAG: ribonucleoside-diphosphate reductase alpha chain, partial [Planctomycetota bacterium]